MKAAFEFIGAAGTGVVFLWFGWEVLTHLF